MRFLPRFFSVIHLRNGKHLGGFVKTHTHPVHPSWVPHVLRNGGVYALYQTKNINISFMSITFTYLEHGIAV